MIQLSRIGDSITGTINMEPFGVKYTDILWKAMTELKAEAEQAVSMDALKSIVEKFEVLTHQDYKSSIETAYPDLIINEGKGTFHLRLPNGEVSEWIVPQPLVDRLLKSIELKMDATPLVKFFIRAIRPVKGKVLTQEKLNRIALYVDYKSVDVTFRDKLIKEEGVSYAVATERAINYQTPVTMEGLLCTYKVSAELLNKFDVKTGDSKPRYEAEFDEDTGDLISDGIPEHVEDRVFYPVVQGLQGGDEFFCEDVITGNAKKGHLIRVGARHFLESWNQVNQNDDASCVKGLHVGNLDYIRNYQSSGTVTHNTFVDPMHIGAITNDGSGALRVLEYFTHSTKGANNRGIYHSSEYAKMTDAQWAVIKAEIAEDAIERAEKVAKEAAVLEGLS